MISLIFYSWNNGSQLENRRNHKNKQKQAKQTFYFSDWVNNDWILNTEYKLFQTELEEEKGKKNKLTIHCEREWEMILKCHTQPQPNTPPAFTTSCANNDS